MKTNSKTRESRARRAFILTLDGFVSLALLASMLSIVVIVQMNPSEPGARALQPLAYDYLVGQYRFDSAALSSAQFNTLTNLTISESEPSGATKNVVSARLRHPSPLCGCTTWSGPCIVTKTDICLTTNETMVTLYENVSYLTPP